MEFLLAPFKWLDGLAQRGVDSVAFFIARRFGIRIAYIRYTIMTCLILSYIGAMVTDIDAENVFFVAILLPVGVFLWLKAQRAIAQEDMKTEGAETVPFYQANLFTMHGCKLFGIISLVVFSADAWTHNVFDIIASNFFIAYGYILRTPNTPPPREETVREPAKYSA